MAEVGSTFVSVIPSARGFGSKLNSQVGGEVDKSGKSVGKRFGTAMKVGALAVVAGGALVGKFLKGAVDDASDLAEATSKVGVVFGKSAGQIITASKSAATSMGLTKGAYLEATGSLGNLLVSLDIAPKKAAGMSQGMVKLASDMASFNNVPVEDALLAIRSGLTGETEPLKRFGVNMNDATLKAQALKMGLIKTTKDAMSPQTKALAAQALIMKQTGTAQGDFARTSGGLANQQKILGAQFGNLKTTIGTALLPVATKFVTFLNGLGPTFKKVGAFIAPAGAAVKSFFTSLSGGGGGGALLTTIKSLGSSIATNFLPVLKTMATTFTTTILPPIQRFGAYLIANLVPIFTKVGSIIATQVVPIIAKLATFLYGTLWPALMKIVTSIAGSLKPVFDALFAQIQTTVLPIVSKLLAKFQEWWPTISKVIMIVLKVIGAVLRLAAAILGKVLPPLIRFVGFLIRNVFSAIATVIGIVVKIIAKIIAFGAAVIAGGKKVGEFAVTVKNKIGDAIGFVKDLPGKAKAALGNLTTVLLQKGRDLIAGLIRGIGEKIGEAIQKVKDGLQKIKDLLPGSPIKAGPLKSWNNTGPTGPGGRLMGLLAEGVSNNGALDAAMTRATSRLAVRSSLTTDFGGGSVARGSAGGATFNIYDRSGDPTRTAHETARQLAFAGGA